MRPRPTAIGNAVKALLVVPVALMLWAAAIAIEHRRGPR